MGRPSPTTPAIISPQLFPNSDPRTDVVNRLVTDGKMQLGPFWF